MSMSSQKPTWLFVSYGGGHVKALLPVALRVRELGLARPVFLALTTAADVVRPTGLEMASFADIVTDADQAALDIGAKLVDQLAVQATDRAQSIAYLGLSYADLQSRLGPDEADRQYGQYGRQAFLPLGPMRRLIEHWKPDLIVASNSPRAERAAIECARAMGISSVCLLDLFGVWERELLARPDYADAICVLNPAVKRELVLAGRPESDVHVTGNPAFDSVLAPEVVQQGQQLRHAQGWADLHVVLYASSPEPQHSPGVPGVGNPQLPRLAEQALAQAVLANPQLALWVRRHPSEPAALELEQLNHPRIRVANGSIPVHVNIHAADEIVVTVSTVGVEAALAGKPVTQVPGSIFSYQSPLFDMGLAKRQLSIEQLGEAFQQGNPQSGSLAGSKATASTPAAWQVAQVLQTVQNAKQAKVPGVS